MKVWSAKWYFLTVSDSGFCPPTPIGSARNYDKQNGCRDMWIFSAQKCAKVEIYRLVQLSGLLTQHKVIVTQHSTDVRQDISWEFRMPSRFWHRNPGIHAHTHARIHTCIDALQHCKYSSYVHCTHWHCTWPVLYVLSSGRFATLTTLDFDTSDHPDPCEIYVNVQLLEF
jgi:hypothetical protein